MIKVDQYYSFYRSYYNKIRKAILVGRALIFIGINSIGKTLLVNQILSPRFQKEVLKEIKTHFIFLSFKDKYPPTKEQLYQYILTQTVKDLKLKLKLKEEINDFSFYSLMSEIIRQIPQNERICFLLLDFQNLLSMDEPFFKSMIYLNTYSDNKLSYLIFSEPHLLDTDNNWAKIFVQHFIRNKYFYLRLFNRRLIMSDMENEAKNYQVKLLTKNKKMIIRHSHGLHGMIGGFCLLFRDYLEIKNIRMANSIMVNHKLFQFWFREILDSLPEKSLSILRKIYSARSTRRFQKNIFFHYLYKLQLVRKNGHPRFPYIGHTLSSYTRGDYRSQKDILLIKNKFILRGVRTDLPKKEFLLLKLFYQSRHKLVSNQQIGDRLWANQPEKYSLWAITQLIRRLRKKLSDNKVNPALIKTVRGQGYLME